MLKAARRHKESVYARMKKWDMLRFSMDREWHGIDDRGNWGEKVHLRSVGGYS